MHILQDDDDFKHLVWITSPVRQNIPRFLL